MTRNCGSISWRANLGVEPLVCLGGGVPGEGPPRGLDARERRRPGGLSSPRRRTQAAASAAGILGRHGLAGAEAAHGLADRADVADDGGPAVADRVGEHAGGLDAPVREDDDRGRGHQRGYAVALGVAEPPVDAVGHAEARGQVAQRLDRLKRVACDDQPRLRHGARRPPATPG